MVVLLHLLTTGPYNPKFPQNNQSNYCWSSYVQHKISSRKFGPKSFQAQESKLLYQHICPQEWVLKPSSLSTLTHLQIEEWDEQVADDLFPGSHLWEDIEEYEG